MKQRNPSFTTDGEKHLLLHLILLTKCSWGLKISAEINCAFHHLAISLLHITPSGLSPQTQGNPLRDGN